MYAHDERAHTKARSGGAAKAKNCTGDRATERESERERAGDAAQQQRRSRRVTIEHSELR